MEIDGEGIATFASGLKLKLRPAMVNDQVIWEALRAIPEPRIPSIWVADLDRFEENPDDPDYQAARERYTIELSAAAIETVLWMATTLVDVPAGIDAPDAFDWERLAAVRNVPESRIKRYEMWLELYGFPGPTGQAAYLELLNYLFREGGMAREEAFRVVATFRNRAGRRGNNRSANQSTHADGNVRPVARPRRSRTG